MDKIQADIIRHPIITDKTTKNIENNIYCFQVVKESSKKDIKKMIESIFNVKVKKINTINNPPKTKTIGRFKGKTTKYKKALIQLYEAYKINLFNNEE